MVVNRLPWITNWHKHPRTLQNIQEWQSLFYFCQETFMVLSVEDTRSKFKRILLIYYAGELDPYPSDTFSLIQHLFSSIMSCLLLCQLLNPQLPLLLMSHSSVSSSNLSSVPVLKLPCISLHCLHFADSLSTMEHLIGNLPSHVSLADLL